jgi:hypothetical protein
MGQAVAYRWAKFRMAGDLKAIWVWRDYLSWPLEGADAFFDDELVDGDVHGAAYPVLNGVGAFSVSVVRKTRGLPLKPGLSPLAGTLEMQSSYTRMTTR